MNINLLTILIIILSFKSNNVNCPPEVILKTIVEYPSQTFSVSTDDGYVIKLFRIQKKFTEIKEGLKPILFVHGIADSSDNFLVNKDNSMALFLANQGYDVWFINNRGSKYSRSHSKFKLKSKEFWNFSFEDLGKYDIPAAINFILDKIGFKKLSVLAHSQGATQVFANLSENISNNKIDKFIAVTPVIYLVL